ncbi:Non-canonical purine NTP pyrophosphatase [Candidatus Terasakiella magnetica]|uniref:dITP/XTP pyrophosphatase n=1 Tax=Candidatus Terasakiella magnetica TaxID=1867952 RepID=A0A1C3REZ4_9PROT|nr:RdgB/HAM1 family non-canonical purine NTP pyrophosphatase [Candidatus Terasakiella magnetica]SCA55831.1 Non-canonical purine NTP pyrophosphatase [Candidatus Terasakiella magnetica]
MRKLEAGKLVIASHNAGKVREIQDLLAPFGMEVISAGDLNLPEPDETGETFEENSLLKSLAAAKASNLPALADDSGLSVAILSGAPGIYSARWAGPRKDFDRAQKKVADAVAEYDTIEQKADRSAAFICALSLAWPDGHTEVFEGRVEGQMTWPARGEKGFGYDPTFIPNGYDITFAEMDPAEKHKISHRADAFQQLVAACFS